MRGVRRRCCLGESRDVLPSFTCLNFLPHKNKRFAGEWATLVKLGGMACLVFEWGTYRRIRRIAARRQATLVPTFGEILWRRMAGGWACVSFARGVRMLTRCGRRRPGHATWRARGVFTAKSFYFYFFECLFFGFSLVACFKAREFPACTEGSQVSHR